MPQEVRLADPPGASLNVRPGTRARRAVARGSCPSPEGFSVCVFGGLQTTGKSVHGAADVGHDGEMSEPVRRLGPEEWRLLREVRLRALADAPYAFESTREEEAVRDDQWWITSVTTLGWFVAVNGAEATGLIAAIPGKESGDHHVISTWVAPERRGSGVAEQLVAAVVAWASEHGASALVLDVAENNPRARRFYERTGFVATGVAKPLRSHPGVATHEMRLELGARRSGAA